MNKLSAFPLVGMFVLAGNLTSLHAAPLSAGAANKETTNSISITMVSIPAGSFIMGCQNERDRDCGSNERPDHTVNLQSFEIGKTEVTQGQWKAVMGDNPSKFTTCGDTCPVDNVSWSDVQAFIRKLNEMTGKEYRLPSEAEWEYACRGGQNHDYCGSNNIDSVAWYSHNSEEKIHPVGQKTANDYALYDMTGNVWEWVQDSYHTNYNGAPSDGSAWNGGVTYLYVLRGGSSKYFPGLFHPTLRVVSALLDRNPYVGFRLAKTLP